MLRKTLIALALSSCTIPCWSNGAYVGVGVGPDLITYNKWSQIALQDFNVIDTSKLASDGVFGTLFAGYAIQRAMLYLAAEINGNISSTRFKSANLEFVHSAFAYTVFKMRSNYGISILPGVNFLETLFYGRLGYANGNFSVVTSDTSLVNVHRNLDGFRYGLGVSRMFTNHLGFRMEYDRIEYQNVQTREPVSLKITKLSPSSNQVEFGLFYRFDAPPVVATK